MEQIEIKRGKYTLRSDRWCFWVDEEYTGKDRKTKEPKTLVRNASGYYADISQLADGFINHMIGESDATSMKKLLHDIKRQKELVAYMTYKKAESLTKEEGEAKP